MSQVKGENDCTKYLMINLNKRMVPTPEYFWTSIRLIYHAWLITRYLIKILKRRQFYFEWISWNCFAFFFFFFFILFTCSLKQNGLFTSRLNSSPNSSSLNLWCRACTFANSPNFINFRTWPFEPHHNRMGLQACALSEEHSNLFIPTFEITTKFIIATTWKELFVSSRWGR